jgi:hypothetical protein
LKPKSLEALYAAIPDSAMKVTDAVRKAVSKEFWRKEKGIVEGVYKADKAIYNSLSVWNWFDIFTFSNLNPLTGAKWTKSGKEKHPVCYNDKFSTQIVKALKLK